MKPIITSEIYKWIEDCLFFLPIIQGILKDAEEVEAALFCYFPGLSLQMWSHLPD